MMETEATETARGCRPSRPPRHPLYELSGLERTFSKGGVVVRGRPRREPRHQQRGDGLARGTERLGQDHAAAAARRPRQPDRRLDPLRRSRPRRAQRQGADEDPRGGDRFRLPALQPHPDADRRGERRHRDVPQPRPLPRASGACQGPVEPGRARPPPRPSAVAALRRRAAARRHRPGAREQPERHHRRRADRQPRLRYGQGGHGDAERACARAPG